MRKFFISVALSILTAAGAAARDGHDAERFHFGIEWGFGQCIYSYTHINIISQEGYRINEISHRFLGKPSGKILAGVSYDLHEKIKLGLYGGWMGISEQCQAYPILSRVSFSPEGFSGESFFTFLSGGVGFRTEAEEYSRALIPIFDGGEGYRLYLTPNFCMDILLSIRAAFDSPLLQNPEGPGIVQEENIRRNVTEFYSLNLSVALSF